MLNRYNQTHHLHILGAEMGIRSMKRYIIFMVTLCMPLVGALSDPLVSACRSVVDGEAEKFVCQLRSTSGKDLNNVSIEEEDGTDLGFTLRSYNWSNDKTALYFLVQTSGVTEKQLERFSLYLSRAAYPVGKQAMGMATAGTTFQQVAGLGAYRPKLESAAAKIATMKPVEGDTVVLRSLSDSIAKLANHKADRKAVFVLTDPNPNANRVDETSLINQALNVNVAIYFVVQGQSDGEPSALLSNISKKTSGGIYTITGLSKNELLAVASRAPERIESGVVLSTDATELPDNPTLKISASVPGEGTLTTSPIEMERQTAQSWLNSQKLFGDNLFVTLAALILSSGLVLLGLSYVSKYRGAQNADNQSKTAGGAEEGDDETRILTQNWSAGQETSAVAWLDLVGSGDSPLALAPGSIRIGRSRDNDVQLTNRSVHRHHAILQVADDATVSIQDLGTKNGVFVNGSRCNECALCVDDVIELGEVKLRLASKPS